MPEQFKMFPVPAVEAPTTPESEPPPAADSGRAAKGKGKMRFLALTDPRRPRNRAKGGYKPKPPKIPPAVDVVGQAVVIIENGDVQSDQKFLNRSGANSV
jgi:hypothetical protein